MSARLSACNRCGDTWGEMTCTLRVGHDGMHIDETVFGSSGEPPDDSLQMALDDLDRAEKRLAAVEALADEWGKRWDVPEQGRLDMTAATYRKAAAELRGALTADDEGGPA